MKGYLQGDLIRSFPKVKSGYKKCIPDGRNLFLFPIRGKKTFLKESPFVIISFRDYRLFPIVSTDPFTSQLQHSPRQNKFLCMTGIISVISRLAYSVVIKITV